MLCNISHNVAINHKSGRVVVQVDPAMKLSLHSALAAEGLSLRDWFVRHATLYLEERQQPKLTFGENRVRAGRAPEEEE
jgi:hypothetical protein